MALLNTWTDANKVIDQGLMITYSRTIVFGNWKQVAAFDASEYTYVQAYELRRFAKGSFRYVGMDYTTATSCANAMIAQYTRTTKVSTWNPDGQALGQAEFVDVGGGTVPMAEVSIQHTDGHMYEVVVNVNEMDSRLRIAPLSPQTVFYVEDARTYPQF